MVQHNIINSFIIEFKVNLSMPEGYKSKYDGKVIDDAKYYIFDSITNQPFGTKPEYMAFTANSLYDYVVYARVLMAEKKCICVISQKKWSETFYAFLDRFHDYIMTCRAGECTKLITEIYDLHENNKKLKEIELIDTFELNSNIITTQIFSTTKKDHSYENFSLNKGWFADNTSIVLIHFRVSISFRK
ncbi:hypothetical protein A3Q56_03014 [Intoshia linei]|uniref:Uncharacterized protein n=1 Tax=Intoshia linei TaxID=1819745 RepID=A0A177B4P6_9BILA|nr:hypothetical protein A3Q56_03014 [Intoshia linei]